MIWMLRKYAILGGPLVVAAIIGQAPIVRLFILIGLVAIATFVIHVYFRVQVKEARDEIDHLLSDVSRGRV